MSVFMGSVQNETVFFVFSVYTALTNTNCININTAYIAISVIPCHLESLPLKSAGRVNMPITASITGRSRINDAFCPKSIEFSGKTLNVTGYAQVRLRLACQPCNYYVHPLERD